MKSIAASAILGEDYCRIRSGAGYSVAFKCDNARRVRLRTPIGKLVIRVRDSLAKA